jgi:hypothetical protein
MAHITIPDEHFAALTQLAHERGLTPDELVVSLIEKLEDADQIAFWGEGIVAELQQQMADYDRQQAHHVLTEDEFFAELASIP